MTHPETMRPASFLDGGGELGALMRAKDWSTTPLGRAESWPHELRMVVRLLLDTRQPMFVFWGPALACLYNDAYRALIGTDRHPSALGQPAREVWAEIWDTIGPQIEQVISGGAAIWQENQLMPITRGGRREDVYWTYGYSAIAQEGAPTGIGGVLVICTETTSHILAERMLAEYAAARTEERDRLAMLFAQAPSFIAMLSGPEHRFDMINAAYSRLIGHREVLGRTVAEALPEVVGQGYLELLDRVFLSGEVFTSRDSKYVAPSMQGEPARVAYLDFVYQPIRNPAGDITGILVDGVDTTERTLAEIALRDLNDTLEQRVAAEIAARSETEAALRQAQKMEAIGQLTGGIAHDFNNMLQGVASGIELAGRRIAAGQPDKAPPLLDAARDAADRAAALTRRLLAFGRRQALDSRTIVADELIQGIAGLIRQTVGPAIMVELVPQDGSWPVCCDPNQLENALLNLAINARDAMLPDGGRLRIETAHVTLTATDTSDWEAAGPGDYVRITVADTGVGMTPAVLARAFEPFFTTKADGRGTGLGLSQIYGFMRQSGGVLRLESEVGLGTSVHLHLPRHAAEPGTGKASANEGPAAAFVGGTVLLVEDEPVIRELMANALRELGYIVLEAANGLDGLAALQRALDGTGVDLLVADVGLPGGLNGRQLADTARALAPSLPVLLITGYAGDAIDGASRLGSGMEVLGKPFELKLLAERVQALIARGRSKDGALPQTPPG